MRCHDGHRLMIAAALLAGVAGGTSGLACEMHLETVLICALHAYSSCSASAKFNMFSICWLIMSGERGVAPPPLCDC